MKLKRFLTVMLMAFIFLSILPANVLAAKDPINEYIKKQGHTISYQYMNLETGMKKGYRANNSHAAASTVKLPLVLYVYELASEGKINLNEKLTYKRKHYNGGSGVIQKHKVGSKYTIRKLAEYAYVESDNIAFVMLRERVGKNNFIKYTKRLGAKGVYPNGANNTTAADMALYTKRLYDFAEKNKLGKELVSYLERAVYRTTIPKGIKGMRVANKAGFIPMNRIYNDTAIIYDKRQPYVLAIMTKGFSYEKSQKVIAQLTAIIHKEHTGNWRLTEPAVKRAEKAATQLEAKYYLKSSNVKPRLIADKVINESSKAYKEARKNVGRMSPTYGKKYAKRMQAVEKKMKFANNYNKAIQTGEKLAERTAKANGLLTNGKKAELEKELAGLEAQTEAFKAQIQLGLIYGTITRRVFDRTYAKPAEGTILSLKEKIFEME